MPIDIVHDTGSFVSLFDDGFIDLLEGLFPEVGGVDVGEVLEELAAEGEDEILLHFLPVGLDEDAAVGRKG